MNKPIVPIWEKALLTVDEASSYTNIGSARLRELAELHEASRLIVRVGTKCLFKRHLLEQYLESASTI